MGIIAGGPTLPLQYPTHSLLKEISNNATVMGHME